MRLVAPLLAAALLSGCATTGHAPGDPYEGFNRAMWGLNRGVDKVALKPAAQAYRFVTPRPVRRGLSAVLSNLSEPWSAVNAFLQGKPKRGLNSLGRFVINTTIGVGGLADHATGMGLKPTPEDFGQTLAVWGVKSSAYLVIPLLGPSTIRDGVGSGVATVADPYQIALNQANLHFSEQAGVIAFTAVDTRANLIEQGADAFLDSAADPYATARSAFLQRRAAQIADRDDEVAATTKGGDSDDAAMSDALKEIDGEAPAATPAPAPAGTPLMTPVTPAPPAKPTEPPAAEPSVTDLPPP